MPIGKAIRAVWSAAFIVFFTLFLLEVAVRIVEGRQLFTVRNWVTESLERNTETHSARYDATLGWSAKPNLDIKGIDLNDPNIPDMSDVVVTTDDRGFRSTGDASDLDAETQPIVTIGDSFTWGSEVSDHETYPAHLQALLKRPVVNAGYGGWGTDQMWMRMQEVGDSLEPALIVLSPLTNDVLRNAYRRYGRAFKPFFEIEGDDLVLRNVPVPRNSTDARDIGVLQSWFGRFYLATFVARAFGQEETWINRNRLTDRVHSNEESVEIACRLLQKTAEFSRARNVPVVLMLVYSGAEILQGERHWFTTQYLACAAESGIDRIDTFDAFVQASRNDPDFPASRYNVWKNGSIAHMNSAGNLLVAEVLAEALRGRGYLD
ncbi:MAG: GDSL-type esterase/lipase family protein [Pseudomonadota bacterium]